MKKSLCLSLPAILGLFVFYAISSAYAVNPTILQNTNLTSPVEQFKSGTPASSVTCNAGLQLVIKADDGSPACVKPDTASILIERGWASEPLSQTSGNTTPTASTSCNTPYQPNSDGFPLNEKGMPSTENGFPLLYMPKNSIGKICVNYYNIYHSGSVALNFFELNPPLITSILATQNSVPAGVGNVTVTYTIKTGNYSGLTGLSLSCGGIFFAVGYDNVSKITHGNFTWNPYGLYSCPDIFYNDNITGLGGIGFKYIK